MPVPILCLEDELCHFVERYRQRCSKPQKQYFVIVLVGLMRMSRGDERWVAYPSLRVEVKKVKRKGGRSLPPTRLGPTPH